jgi:hypothetical protein
MRMKVRFVNSIIVFLGILLVLIPTFTHGQTPKYVPDSGLVGWWPFNGNANDVSGNGNNGTVTGATLISGKNGANNSAYFFNGVSDFITIPDTNLLDFTNAFTISVWVRLDEYSNGDERVVIGKQRFANATGYQLTASSAHHSSRYMGAIINNNLSSVVASDSLALNKWEFLSMTYGSGVLKLYRNGILENSVNSSIVLNNSTQPVFFGKEFGNSRYFKGGLDDIGFWNRALSESEILALYNSCELNVSKHPSNLTSQINSNATFTVNSNKINSNYQWQSDLGTGFQNLTNAGQYSGVQKDTLIISNISIANNNQIFRCIISNDNCYDTSDVAILTVTNNTGINKSTTKEGYRIYPNPASTFLNIDIPNKGQIIVTLTDITGQTVITPTSGTIDISTLANGLYILNIYDHDNKLVSTNKVMILR